MVNEAKLILCFIFLVVKAHRGRVEVSSAEGDGLKFQNSLYARDLVESWKFPSLFPSIVRSVDNHIFPVRHYIYLVALMQRGNFTWDCQQSYSQRGRIAMVKLEEE
jgi:hypothetical protein